MIAVTGATGKLGQLAIEALLKRIPAEQIVVAVRAPSKAGELAARGVQVREADYTKPETLRSAFAGVEKLLLISSNQIGQRVEQHSAVIDAAVQAGVRQVAYTSILHAETSTLQLAEEHKGTEAYLRSSGLSYIFLRNGWYTENLTGSLAQDTIPSPAQDGRFATASRADYAEAAAVVLTSNGHDNAIYELAGDNSLSLPELAAKVSELSGRQVRYQYLTEEAYTAMLVSVGLPQQLAEILADADAGAQRGELDDNSHTLSKLIGRATTPWEQTTAAAVAALQNA